MNETIMSVGGFKGLGDPLRLTWKMQQNESLSDLRLLAADNIQSLPLGEERQRANKVTSHFADIIMDLSVP